MEPQQPMNDLVAFATIFVLVGFPCLTVIACKYLKYKYRNQPKNTGNPGNGFTLPDESDQPDIPPPPPPSAARERWTSNPWPSRPAPQPSADEMWQGDNPMMRHAENVNVPGLTVVE